jgi:signal-transduction protein with cAMP-binding, CBS, and nucleotidyltransferase domain
LGGEMGKENKIDLEIFKVPLSNFSLLPPLTVDESTEIGQTLGIMQDKHIGSIVVTQKNKLVGIVTERDFLMKSSFEDPAFLHFPISKIMTHRPDSLKKSDPFILALYYMNRGGYRHIPILDEQENIAGIISIKDILSYLMKHIPEELIPEIELGDDLPDHL